MARSDNEKMRKSKGREKGEKTLTRHSEKIDFLSSLSKMNVLSLWIRLLFPVFLDHKPLLLENGDWEANPSFFKFENMWLRGSNLKTWGYKVLESSTNIPPSVPVIDWAFCFLFSFRQMYVPCSTTFWSTKWLRAFFCVFIHFLLYECPLFFGLLFQQKKTQRETNFLKLILKLIF